jgi:NTE family protein
VPRVAIVLGAGGAVGHAFHAGVLSALADETGWDPRRADILVGTSAGSVVASMLRAGFSASDLAARALGRELSAEGRQFVQRSGLRPPPAVTPARPAPARGSASPVRLARAFWQPWRARPGTIAAALLPECRIPNETMSEPLRRMFGSEWPSPPLWVVAVALDSGRRVVFGREGAPATDVAAAVAASCAIPAYFVPVTIHGSRYVDGGVHSPSNADVVARETLDLVIVSSPMSSARGVRRQAIDVPMRQVSRLALAREVAALRRRGTTVVTFQPTAADQDAMAGNPLDPAKRAPVCRQVFDSTMARLHRADLKRLLALLR